MVAMVKAGVELAFETMVDAGIKPESAYYESLHETPLIANLISRKKLYEMNKADYKEPLAFKEILHRAVMHGIIEYDYGDHYNDACRPLLKDFMAKVDTDIIGKGLANKDNSVSNQELVKVNEEIRNHPIEIVGKKLRGYMTAMKAIVG